MRSTGARPSLIRASAPLAPLNLLSSLLRVTSPHVLNPTSSLPSPPVITLSFGLLFRPRRVLGVSLDPSPDPSPPSVYQPLNRVPKRVQADTKFTHGTRGLHVSRVLDLHGGCQRIRLHEIADTTRISAEQVHPQGELARGTRLRKFGAEGKHLSERSLTLIGTQRIHEKT